MIENDTIQERYVRSTDENRTPAAIIYTHSLLEGSMTFIKSQAESLVRYQPVFVGAHRIDGIDLPADRTYVLNEHTLMGVFRETLFRQWGWAPKLMKDLVAHGPEIVHAHFGNCGPAGMAIAERLGVPLVVTFHGQDATMKPDEARKSYRGRELLNNKAKLIRRTGVFVAVSNHIRDVLIDQGYPESKVVVQRNGIDLERFRPTASVKRKPVILFVGRFVEKKGTQYLIEAARVLRSAGVNFELVMVGSGPLESELKNAADEAQIPCRFVGFLTIEEVGNWLQRASVVAVPSVTASDGDSEGLPTILLEAQAMETPVVATRHSGIPEGVREGVTAELVDERDVTALAENLRTFLESPAKVLAFGQAGRRYVTEHFDMRTQVRGLEDIYMKLCAKHYLDSERSTS